MNKLTARTELLAGILLSGGWASLSKSQLERTVGAAIGTSAERLWLLFAVMTATLPVQDEVVNLVRMSRLMGSQVAFQHVRRLARTRFIGRLGNEVRILQGETIVDAHHTARSELATGIQKVVRKTIVEWEASHTIILVGWDADYTRLRMLDVDERENALFGTRPNARQAPRPRVTIPWNCDYILPELATEPDRTARIQALAQFSNNRLHVVGHDCVPLTTAETVGPGMGGAFAKNLSAVARATRVATTSTASTAEYRGWRTMLGSIGVVGPEIQEIMLPTAAEFAESESESESESEGTHRRPPLLLCVGSHEPRKNHLAVLHACELLWRERQDFELLFVGGNSWNSDAFEQQLDRMIAFGRPVRVARGLSDRQLWQAYREATLTLFPSVNEGFGLPVAESLAVGTPVVTSNFGSMKEIADAGGGALLVDPRDDATLAEAIREFLTNSELRDRLRLEAAARTQRTWTQYADDLWHYFDPQVASGYAPRVP